MAFHETATRVWKGLPVEDRRLAATAFFREPSPELVGSALGALVRARRLRPQAARALAPEAQAGILATVLDRKNRIKASETYVRFLDHYLAERQRTSEARPD